METLRKNWARRCGSVHLRAIYTACVNFFFYVYLKGCVSSVVALYILGFELVEMREVEGVAFYWTWISLVC